MQIHIVNFRQISPHKAIMIHSFSFSNFQSFHEEVSVDFTVNSKQARENDWMAHSTIDNTRLNKAIMVVGANAAGKTSVLKALTFLNWFATNSFNLEFNKPLPFYHHLNFSEEPSSFGITRENDGYLWRYHVKMHDNRVIEESLFRTVKKEIEVFSRIWKPNSKTYTVKAIKEFGGDNPALLKTARENVSLISWAAQFNVPLAKQLIQSWSQFTSNVTEMGFDDYSISKLFNAAHYFKENVTDKAFMERLLRQWDFGLSSVNIKPQNTQTDNQQPLFMPYGKHESESGMFELPFLLESHGTQVAFSVLSKILPALSDGTIAIIDEIETNLHPEIIEQLISLFASKEKNPKNAQILFSSHSLELMNKLHKSQIYFTEKRHLVSSAYRLDDFKGVREDDNYYAKYRAGVYGALPEILE